MALAPVAYQLWQQELRYDPTHPIWPNRDRFVLSNGHASMLLYSLLHLTGVRRVTSTYTVEDGVAVSLEDIGFTAGRLTLGDGQPFFEQTANQITQRSGLALGGAAPSR